MLKKLFLSVAFLSAFAAAQAQQSLGDLVAQEGLDWIAGTWVGQDDNGSEITLVYKWELDKNMVSTMVKTSWMESKGISLLCQKTGEVRYVAGDNQGSSVMGAWDLVNGNPTLRVEYNSASGDSGKGAYVHKKIDANTLEVSVYMGDSAEYLSGTPETAITFKRK
jgi:hypothetical protein